MRQAILFPSWPLSLRPAFRDSFQQSCNQPSTTICWFGECWWNICWKKNNFFQHYCLFILLPGPYLVRCVQYFIMSNLKRSIWFKERDSETALHDFGLVLFQPWPTQDWKEIRGTLFMILCEPLKYRWDLNLRSGWPGWFPFLSYLMASFVVSIHT